MSVPIVIDEWIYSDLSGENGPEKTSETFLFLVKLLEICDRLVIVKQSKVEQKIEKWLAHSGEKPSNRAMSAFYQKGFLFNKDKIILKNLDLLPLLDKKIAKLVNPDDHYLIRAHLGLNNSFILTTDERLQRALSGQKNIKIELRDTFVANYLKK